MKRILAVLMTCLILASMLNIGAFAFSKEVGNIDVPKLGCDDVITIDGKINTKTEFWSETTVTNLNDSNTSTAWNYRARVVTNTDIRFAYSNEGLYIAAFTTDDTPIRSTGHELHEITGEDGNIDTHAWNGDTIILAFDPLQTMTYSYTEWADYSQKCPAWYCFTLMEDGTTGAWRTKTMEINYDGDDYVYYENGDISDVVDACAASFVDGVWNLEVFIPWSELAYTLGLVTDGNYVFDAEEFAKSGVVHSAKFIYMNRYAYNQKDGTDYSGFFLGYPDTGTVVTICRNFTVSDMIPGTEYQGIMGNPEQARTSGIYLNLVDNTDDDDLHTPADAPEIIDSTCTEMGKSTIYCTKCHEIISREYIDLKPHEYYVSDAATGKQVCSVCNTTAGAVVNGTDAYATFSAAYAAANAGDTIKLFAGETMFSTLALDKDVTIDLNGKTVKSESGPVFEISADVVFNNGSGTGKVTGNGVDIPVKIVGGTTTVNKGRFSGEGVEVFDVATGAELVINGGQIRSIAEGLTSHFAGEGTVTVYGGVFRGADPSDKLASCLGVSVYVDEADGYTEYTVEAHHNTGDVDEKLPTCTEDGYRKASCIDCGRPAIDEVLPALGHTAADIDEKLPTCTEDGYRKANCSVCGEVAIDEVVPATGHTESAEQTIEMTCTVDGAVYTVCTVCGETLTYEVISPASGHMYKLTEVAPTCTEGGTHSFVCHCGDTHTYAVPALGHEYAYGVCTRCGDADVALVSADGLDVTVSNLAGVRDFLIAPGHYETYSGVKNNYTLRVTAAKFGDAGSYTATVNAPGEYTVLVRYTDGSEQAYYYVNAEAVTPEFTVNGLSVSISNLEGLRTIRTAPGKWNTPGEVKRAEGARNIAARNIETDSYKLQYSESGLYTITLEYENGLVVVEYVEISATEPTMVQDGNVVTLGNLENLYVVRYAPGEYSSIYDIKRADGAKYLRSSKVDENGEIKIELDGGVYTICVQYNDGSCNYFTVN